MSKSNRNFLVVLLIVGGVVFTCCGLPVLMVAVQVARMPDPAPVATKAPAVNKPRAATAPAKSKQELRLVLMELVDKDQDAATKLTNKIDANGGVDQLSPEMAGKFVEVAKTMLANAAAVVPVGQEVNPVLPAVSAKEPLPGLTYANFGRIKTGMTATEVVAILGEDATVLSESEFGAGTEFHTRTVLVQWQAGLKNCSVMFQNGKMVQNAQFGLK